MSDRKEKKKDKKKKHKKSKLHERVGYTDSGGPHGTRGLAP